MLAKINREIGTTIILSEHRLEDAIPLSDRIIVMEEGRIIADGTTQAVGKNLYDAGNDMLCALPTPMRVHFGVPNIENCPVTIREGRTWLEKISKAINIQKDIAFDISRKINAEAVVSLKDIWFRYEKNLPDIIKGLSIKVHKGEIFAVVGGNGTGKTTALSVIMSVLSPYRGKRKIIGKTAMLPQNPQLLFTQKSVRLELEEIANDEKSVADVISVCELEYLLDKHPYDLSGGEAQRAALAKVLLTKPDILLLDEPTKGLDAPFKKKLAQLLSFLRSQEITVIMVSHDIEFCAKYADRCGMFFDGSIVSEDTPREFFSGKSFYTTAANRMSRDIIPNAVLAEDIIKACGKNIEN